MDDEEMIRDVASEMIKRIGYEVELANDGAEVIKIYKKIMEAGQTFDAVIMDLTVPGGMGGTEAMEKLLEVDPDVKSIVSSGYYSDPIMADYKKYGFSAVIAKPYRVRELRRLVRDMLQERHS